MFSEAGHLKPIGLLLKNTQFGSYIHKPEKYKLQWYCRHAGNLDNLDIRKIFSLESHVMEIFILVSYINLNHPCKNYAVLINVQNLLGIYTAFPKILFILDLRNH